MSDGTRTDKIANLILELTKTEDHGTLLAREVWNAASPEVKQQVGDALARFVMSRLTVDNFDARQAVTAAVSALVRATAERIIGERQGELLEKIAAQINASIDDSTKRLVDYWTSSMAQRLREKIGRVSLDDLAR